MDPDEALGEDEDWRFPRTRGDGPMAYRGLGQDDTFPPHARGWTGPRSPRGTNLLVSPARAGMDRVHPRRVLPLRRFPRTRGDGPWALARLKEHKPFPPHARGWTVNVTDADRTRAVSPARAGMDPSSGSRPY